MTRHTLLTSVVLAAAMVPSGVVSMAQADPQMGGGGQGQGQRRGGGGGGFGGGQMIQGTVTAATASRITIKTDAGDSYDVTVTDTTRVMRDRAAIKISDVKVGDGVGAMGTVDATAKTIQAMFLTDVDAETVKKNRENMGKTYITGRITAIDADNLKLTITRTDTVSQVIAVDEGTSFQRGARGITVPGMVAMGGGRGMGAGGGGGQRGGAGGNPAGTPPAPESITLADIKVGDSVVATGSVKGGAFTPDKMGVTPAGGPGGGGRRRPAAGADGTAAPPAATPPSQ